tara:strand:- start:23964 stop:25118 length:1155 start_codon:yes stop_codon:yes gene_type:complete
LENNYSIEIVDSNEKLINTIKKISKEDFVAVDIESNGLHRFKEQICLIQLAIPGAVFIVDPLQISEIAPLGKLLFDKDIEKIFHSPDHDLRSFDRDWNFQVRNIFDTSTAAAFLGSEKLGLSSILSEYLKIELSKSKSLQRSDWTLRPIPKEALQYAINDVLYLKNLRDLLLNELANLKRTHWVFEEFKFLERIKYIPKIIENPFLSIKGSKTLDIKSLTILSRLYEFRQNEAIRLNRPTFKIVHDNILIEISKNPEIDLTKIKDLGIYSRSNRRLKLIKAIKDAQNSTLLNISREELYPKRKTQKNMSDSQVLLFKNLKDWRLNLSKKLKLQPSLIWPLSNLKNICMNLDNFENEIEHEVVRKWQRKEFSDSLRHNLISQDVV